MAMGNLRSRNASTALGLMWWVINPILQGAVYYIVFDVILGVSRDLAYLLSGVFVFYYTSTSITTGANAIIQNRTLLVNLQFPKLIMPVTAITEAGVGFLTSIPALYLIVGPIQGVWPSVTTLWLFPIAFALHSIFNLGLAALAARFAVPFRDITNVIPHLLRIWFYLSPILYSASRFEKLPDWAEVLYRFNPLVPILGIYRTALIGDPFVRGDIVASAVWAFGLTAVAIFMFVKYEGKMARYL